MTDVKKEMKELGYDQVELPPGTDLNDFGDSSQSQGDVPTDKVEGQQVETTPQPSPTELTEQLNIQQEQAPAEQAPAEPQEEQLTPEERAKRWQSTADKNASELEKERLRRELAEEQAKAMQTHAEYLKQQFSNVQPPTPTKETKKPEVQDFIVQGSWDPAEAGDPSTPSGQAMLRYNEALADYKVDQRLIQERANWEQEQQARRQEEIASKKAEAFCVKYPDFRDPFSGKPNYQKIQDALSNVMTARGDSEWADYYEWATSNNGEKPTQAPITAAQMTQQINDAANKPSSVSSAGVVKDKAPEVPKDVKELNKYFGDIELPPDFKV